MICPDGNDIQGFIDHALDAAATEAVATHLERCDRCRELVLGLARAQRELLPTLETSRFDGDAQGQVGPRAPLPPGMTIGRYVLSRVLGVGGMGVVYAGRDVQLERDVAVKLLRPDAAVAPPMQQARLWREAQAMARLSHPNVITVYEVGKHDDQVFVSMELVAGGTLSEWLHAAPRPWREIVRAFRAAGEGLSAAHAAGLVHRDFKPDNVLVRSDGRFCVGDFGLARASGEASDSGLTAATERALDQRLTRTGAVVGTPAYMAPEQARSDAADQRSDQFSFCVALWEALYGVRPFSGATVAERLAAVDAGPPRPPRGAKVPRYLAHALTRGLAADPNARFVTMDALLVALAPRRRALAWLAIPVAVVAAALATTALWRTTHHASNELRAVVQSVRRLTFAPGCEGAPSFTPDGKTLVYHHNAEDGEMQLYALDLASGSTRQLTRGPALNMVPAVSPDGRYIAYAHDGEGPRELRLQKLDGSDAPRTIAESGGYAMWLSPTVVATSDGYGNFSAWSLDGTAVHPQVASLPQDRMYGTVSPFADGALAFNSYEDDNNLGIGVVAHDGVHLLAEHVPFLYRRGLLAAPSGKSVYFARRNGAVNELVRVSRAGGELQVLGGGIAPTDGTTIAADGGKLVFSACQHNNRLVLIDDDERPVALVPSGDWNDFPVAAIDRQRLLFTSNRSGPEQAYVFDSAKGSVIPVSPGGIDLAADVSKDGRWFVYTTQSPPGLWVGSVDGSTPPRRLAEVKCLNPVFSHDDRQVIFERGVAGDSRLWIVPFAGGAPRQLLSTMSRAALTSPADDRIVFMAWTGTEWQLTTTNERGAPPVPVPVSPSRPGTSQGFARSRDGRRVLVVRPGYERPGYEVVEIDLDGKRPPRVKHRLKRWIVGVIYAADDEHVIVALEFTEGDLWLAEGRFP
jgi:Tol biopolymer transport system component/tRNA A-37 threonylcarbamoyl transferase component Bud32